MADYEWSYEVPIEGAPLATAEKWLRAIWEEGPRILRVILPLAWKYGLGLRLGAASDPERVLGWHIATSEPNIVVVDADSPLMTAENSVLTDRNTLRWTTTVDFKNIVGRALWMPAHVIHQWIVRRAVHRAARWQMRS